MLVAGLEPARTNVRQILSVFIDESGDFGPYDFHAPFYLVAMVLHNQGNLFIPMTLCKNAKGFLMHYLILPVNWISIMFVPKLGKMNVRM